ncbi:MAG: hypothetical protein WC705_01520 [Candidatus Paceibacterota bacterium]|jgi:hypothetical protein
MSENDQLFGLIRKQIESGSRKEDIISNLIFAGYKYQEIEGAFGEMEEKGEIPLNFWSHNNEIKTRASILKSDYESVSGAVNAEPEPLTGVKSFSYSISKHKFLYSLFLFIFIALIGGFLGWYFLNFSSPYKILEKSINASAFVDSFKYMVDATTSDASFNSNGVINVQDSSEIKKSFSLIKKDLYSEETVLSISVIHRGENIFIKSEKLTSQWIKISPQSDTSKISFIPKEFMDYLTNYNKLSLSFAPFKISPTFFKSFEKINDGGTDFYHIRFVPNKDLGAYLFSVFDIIFNTKGWVNIENLSSGTWDVYINRTDLLAYKVVLSGVDESIDVSLSEFNKSFDIKEPFSWITVEKFIAK